MGKEELGFKFVLHDQNRVYFMHPIDPDDAFYGEPTKFLSFDRVFEPIEDEE